MIDGTIRLPSSELSVRVLHFVWISPSLDKMANLAVVPPKSMPMTFFDMAVPTFPVTLSIKQEKFSVSNSHENQDESSEKDPITDPVFPCQAICSRRSKNIRQNRTADQSSNVSGKIDSCRKHSKD